MTQDMSQSSSGRISVRHNAMAGASRDARPFFTKRSLCAYLSISPSTLDRLVRSGKLAAHRIGGQVRFDPDEVDEFITATKE